MAATRTLHAEELGQGPRLVLLHGFTQLGACLRDLAEELASSYTVVLPDLPGHGRSSEVRASLPAAAALLADSLGPATWVGYSMGGRHALHVAVHHPQVVEGLVVLGATAGIRHLGQRAARRRRDEALADRIVEMGVDAFLDEWLAQPLFASLPPDPADRALRAANTAEGLAASLRLAGTGTQEPLDDALRALRAPTLVLAGERDAKFRAEAVRLTSVIGAAATVAVVPGAGHAAHAEQPAAFLELVTHWLHAHPPR